MPCTDEFKFALEAIFCITLLLFKRQVTGLYVQSIKTGVSLSITVNYFAPMPGMKECKIIAQVLILISGPTLHMQILQMDLMAL